MDEDDIQGGEQDGGDAPLIDLNEASIKKLIARAKRRGVITVDELNEALPADMSSDQIEDITAALNEMGVNIVESDEDAVDPEEKEVDEVDDSDSMGAERPAVEKKKETVDRTDDPVRMYLREMGAVELLSREGEIAIAKRIEAGRDTMILGLCESPITFHAIIQWSEALNAGEMQLREILDLDAMLSKEPAPRTSPKTAKSMATAKFPKLPRVPRSRTRTTSRKRNPPTVTRTRTVSNAAPAVPPRKRKRTTPSAWPRWKPSLSPMRLRSSPKSPRCSASSRRSRPNVLT